MGVSLSAQASDNVKKQIRNDRVSVSSSIPQFDINPFSDRKRVVRNDRVSYSKPKVNVESSSTKKTFVRNDHIIVKK